MKRLVSLSLRYPYQTDRNTENKNRGRGMQVSLQLSGIEGITAMQAFVERKGIQKATKYGLGYASRAGKTEAAKQIRARYNISSARIKQDIAGPFVSPDASEARLVFTRKPPSALQYGARDNGKGLTVSIFRGQRKPVSRGFLLSSGSLQGKPFRRVTRARTPIDFVSGPSIGSIFAGQSQFGDQIRDQVSNRINEQFTKGFERKMSERTRRG